MAMTDDKRQELLSIVREAVSKYGTEAVRHEVYGAHNGFSVGAPREIYPEILRDPEVRTLLRQYRNSVSPNAQDLVDEAQGGLT